MEKIKPERVLCYHTYPGRGIAVAMAPDGRQMFIGYFIMGRSENSRNRVFDPVPSAAASAPLQPTPQSWKIPAWNQASIRN